MNLAVAIVLSSNAAKLTVARDHQAVRIGRASVDACAVARAAAEYAYAACEDADRMLRKLKVKLRRRKSVRMIGRKMSTINIFEGAWKEELDVKMRRWMEDRFPYIETSFSQGKITLTAPLEFVKNSATPSDPQVRLSMSPYAYLPMHTHLYVSIRLPTNSATPSDPQLFAEVRSDAAQARVGTL